MALANVEDQLRLSRGQAGAWGPGKSCDTRTCSVLDLPCVAEIPAGLAREASRQFSQESQHSGRRAGALASMQPTGPSHM